MPSFRKVVTITFRMAAESFKLEVLRTIDMLIASLDDLAMTMINTDITMGVLWNLGFFWLKNVIMSAVSADRLRK